MELEDLQEYEIVDLENGFIILGIRAKFRGHVIGARSSVAPEVSSDPELKEVIRRVMMESIEFQASRLDPVLGNPINDQIYQQMDNIMNEIIRERVPPPKRKSVNWQKEGF